MTIPSPPSKLVSTGCWPGHPLLQLRLECDDGTEQLGTLAGAELLERLSRAVREVLAPAENASN